MDKQIKIIITAIVGLILALSLISSMTISSVDADNFSPGEEQSISVDIRNNDDNAENVSLELVIPEDSYFAIINSDDEKKDIDEDDSESFDFKIKASNDAKAGTYQIPYIVTYDGADGESPKKGKISLTIEANPELSYTANVENPIIGSKGKIKFTIINKGLGDAKFVGIKINPQGYTLLSANNDYIGTIGSDDFETINFDVIFKETNPVLIAEIEYRDFNNQKIIKNINLPVKIYSNEEALNLGIIQKNNTFLYILLGIIGIAVFVIVRKIRKKKRQNKSQGK